MLKISQNNDNRGRHLEFYSHTGIGTGFSASHFTWSQFLSSGSGSGSVSGSGSGFRIPAFPYARFGPKSLEILVEWIAPTVSRNFSRELEFDLARKLRHLIFHAALIHLSKIYFQV